MLLVECVVKNSGGDEKKRSFLSAEVTSEAMRKSLTEFLLETCERG